jgi:hypothetical protein
MNVIDILITIDMCTGLTNEDYIYTYKYMYVYQYVHICIYSFADQYMLGGDMGMHIHVFLYLYTGLTNEDVAEADAIISIPSFKHFSSLNLAQAVNIVGFELWKENLAISDYSPPELWLHPRYI